MADLFDIDIPSHFSTYSNEIFRLVEAQYVNSTRQLVDSDQEQEILEQIIDNAKPIAPTANSKGSLHYLLYTPFRYPPLHEGGRFHRLFEQSLFYGSEELTTAMAEIAYHRFRFIKASKANFAPSQIPYTSFVVKISSKKAIQLTQSPFFEFREQISDKENYQLSQKLGTRMRTENVELFTFYSARIEQGINVGVFSIEAFACNAPLPHKTQSWAVFIDYEKIEFKPSDITLPKITPTIFHFANF